VQRPELCNELSWASRELSRGIAAADGWFASDVTVLRGAKVRAPEFPSGSWFNSDRPLSLRELRGKKARIKEKRENTPSGR